MAGNTGTTALQTAIQGGKVSDKAARSALDSAVSRISNLTKKANTSKEAMVETGTLVLHAAETQGSLFLASMAEGYLGEDKLKLGSVDLRAPVGLLATGYGLYQTMNGQKGSGQHVLALGTGVMGSWLSNVARNAGRTLAEKRGGQGAEPPPAPSVQLTPGPPAPPVVLMQGAPMLSGPGLLPEPGVAGPVREVLLTPEATAGDDFGRRPRRQLRERLRERREEDDEEALEGEDLAGEDEVGRGGRGGGGRGRGGRGRQRMQRMRQQRQQRRQQDEDEEQSLEGDDEPPRRPRGRFVRARDDE